MRGTIRSFAVISGTITCLVLAVVVISPLLIIAGTITTLALGLVSVAPYKVAGPVAGKLADMQLFMGRTMAHKVWIHMR